MFLDRTSASPNSPRPPRPLGTGVCSPDPSGFPLVLIANRYQTLRMVGQGKFGKVFVAKDLRHSTANQVKLAAVKYDYSGLNLLKHEATMLNFLYQRCPAQERAALNIPKVLWFGVVESVPALVMNHFNGGTFAQWVKQHSPFTPHEVNIVAQSLLATLKSIHQLAVVHRDLKPENLVLDDQGRLMVIDFGLAMFYVDGNTGRHIPKTGGTTQCVVGSPLYVSTHTHLGVRNARRDDCLQVGYILLYMMLEGQLPWERDYYFALESERNGTDHPPRQDADLLSIGSPLNRLLYMHKTRIKCNDPTWTRYMERCTALKYDQEPEYIYGREDGEEDDAPDVGGHGP